MKVARLAVLGVALAAGGGAAYFMSAKTPAPVQVMAPTIDTDEVLVASKDLPMGTLVGEVDLMWQQWPTKATSPGMMTKSQNPNAMEDVKGSVLRSNFIQGEPIRKDKLVKGPNSGFMSAIVPSGLRAVAINIETGGSTSAGGFVLPNDHVDVLRTFRDMTGSKSLGQDIVGVQTLLTNVRVLAIGQNVQEKNGERIVVGATATLELDPAQSELITLAQRSGQLSLALRSMVDSTQPAKTFPLLGSVDESEGPGLSIVRFGVPAGGQQK